MVYLVAATTVTLESNESGASSVEDCKCILVVIVSVACTLVV